MRIGKRILKILGWTTAVLLLLHVLIVLLLQVPAVQSYLTQKAVDFYTSKTGAKAQIEEISLHWFKTVHLGGVYLEEPNGDTLVYLGSLSTSIDFMAFLDHTIAINTIELEGFKGNISQSLPDSSFNFNFIIEAFARADSTTEITELADSNTTTEAFDITIEGVSLKDIDVRYEDETSAIDLDLELEALEIDFTEFSLLEEIIHIDRLYMAGTELNYQLLKDIASSEEVSDRQPLPYDLALNELQFERIGFNIETPDGGYTHCYIGELKGTPNRLDLQQQEIDIETLFLSDGKAAIHLPRSTDTVEKEIDSIQTIPEGLPWNVGWALDIAHLQVANTDLDFATVSKSTTAYFNPDFIEVKDFNTEISDLKLDASSIGLHILSGSAKERGGTELKNLQVELYASNECLCQKPTTGLEQLPNAGRL